MHKAPVTVQVDHPEDGAFLLWQKMAAKQPEMGNSAEIYREPGPFRVCHLELHDQG